MADSLHRCAWCGTDPLYVAYHDEEWGVPEYDPRALWEKLLLDGFQAGLAWITILRKREGMRDAFDGFDPEIVARYGEADIERLADLHPTRPEGLFAIVSKGDEVLDWREMQAFCAGGTVRLLEGSNHAISDFDGHMDAVFQFLNL